MARKKAKKPPVRTKITPKGQRKVKKVIGEFKRRTLKSSSGRKVTNPKQAIAIGLSEAREAQRRRKK